MKNITAGKKDLKQSTDVDHSFNSKVSNIVDAYLFNKETGLKRKSEPENVVGTKKDKKSLRRLEFSLLHG